MEKLRLFRKGVVKTQPNMGGIVSGIDMPIGLGMLLMEDQIAFSRFGTMSPEEKKQVLSFVESGTDGEDAKRRINHTVKSLHDGVPGFYKQ